MSNHDNTEALKQAEEAAKKITEEKTESTTKEQVLQSALGFYLPDIMERARNLPSDTENKNVFNIKDEGTKTVQELPAFSNILTKKDDVKICDLEIFTNIRENVLFLNQAVPYVKIYKTIKNKTTNENIDIELPFDVVAGQKSGDPETLTQKILSGGSGGAVGVIDFSWKTEGKNEGNNSIYTVNFKIFMQDASELEKIRNRVDGQSVAILDLLYYGFLNDGEDGESNFDPDYLEFKAEVGFNFSPLYQKYNNFFKTTLNLKVYKHNFSFNETGKVELDIIAIGNIESDFSNKTKYNILEDKETKKYIKLIEFAKSLKNYQTKDQIYNKIRELPLEYKEEFANTLLNFQTAVATENVALDAWKESTKFGLVSLLKQFTITNMPGDFSVAEYVSNLDFFQSSGRDEVKELQEAIEEIIPQLQENLKAARISIINKLINKMYEKSKINFLILNEFNFESLKLFISTGGDVTEADIRSLKEHIDNITSNTPDQKNIDKENSNYASVEAKGDSYNLEDLYVHGLSGFFSIERKAILVKERKQYLKQLLKEKYGEEYSQKTEIIDYIFLGDLLQLVIDESPELQQDINIFLSPFSYYDYKTTFSDLEQRKSLNHKIVKNGEQTKYYNVYNLDRKVGDLYYVPISINSIIKWYQDSVTSKEEQAYTFNSFIKFCMSDLIKQNIATKVAPASPHNSISINPYYFNTEVGDYPFQQSGSLSIEELSSYYSMRNNKFFIPKKYKKNIAFISVAENNYKEFYGDYLGDCEKGILHLPVNSSNSLVKRINFSRDDDALLETANLQAANTSNPNKIIRQVYQANVEMFGNSFFEPGNLVFLNPNYPGVGLRNKTLIRIGLGGYYRIVEIDNKLSTGGYGTTLRCIWEMSADGKSTSGKTSETIQIEDTSQNAQNQT